MSAYPLAAPSTPSWTAMAWWLGNGALAPKPKARLCPKGLLPMLCGVPTTRASSCWEIKDIQLRTSARSSRHEISCRNLQALHATLSRHRRAFLSLPRSVSSCHLLRKNLHLQKENQSQHFSRRSSCGYQRGRRRYLVGELYGLRSRLHRS